MPSNRLTLKHVLTWPNFGVKLKSQKLS